MNSQRNDMTWPDAWRVEHEQRMAQFRSWADAAGARDDLDAQRELLAYVERLDHILKPWDLLRVDVLERYRLKTQEHITMLHDFWREDHEDRVETTRRWIARAEERGDGRAAQKYRADLDHLLTMRKPWETHAA